MSQDEISLFENDLDTCISPFVVARSQGESNQLKADIFGKRDRIINVLKTMKAEKGDQAFSDVVTSLVHSLNRVGEGYTTIFVVDLIQKGQFNLPNWLGNPQEVARTVLGMTCVDDMADIEKEQILYRDSIKKQTDDSISYRVNRLQNLRTLSNMLKQPKGQKIVEGSTSTTGPMRV